MVILQVPIGQGDATANSGEDNTDASEDTVEYYDGDRLMPVFIKSAKTPIGTISSATTIINSDNKNKLIATAVPSYISNNVIFLIDSSHRNVGGAENIKCDPMGSWKPTRGVERTYIRYNKTGTPTKITKESYGFQDTYEVLRYRYTNASANDLHKIIIIVKNQLGHTLPLVIVQYRFDGIEHKVNIKPHGNRTHGSFPYQRTYPSQLNFMRSKVKNFRGKQVVRMATDEVGGTLAAVSAGQLPKDRQQAYNLAKQVNREEDPINSIRDLIKMQSLNRDTAFVRDLAQPDGELQVYLGNKRQHLDLIKMTTDPANFCPMQVDGTFNIGKFIVTLVSYRHLKLQTKKSLATGEPVNPVLLGPALIHQRKGFISYAKLANDMKKYMNALERNGLDPIVLGSDGEPELSDAFKSAWILMYHFLCEIHMYDNTAGKLNSLCVAQDAKKKILVSIFGQTRGTSKVKGLVDSYTGEEFDRWLEIEEENWKAYTPKGKEFAQWFRTYKVDLIKSCMMADLREMCGLGYPPISYTSNAAEAENSGLKGDVKEMFKTINRSKLTLIEAIKTIQRRVESQQDEVLKAILGKTSEYVVLPEYKHLCPPNPESFLRKNKDEMSKSRVAKKFFDAPLLPRKAITRQTAEPDSNESLSALSNARVAVIPPSGKDMPAMDLGITVPPDVKEDIWLKAAVLESKQGSITPYPGELNSDFLVENQFNPREPYHVRIVGVNGKIQCQKNCPRFAGYGICSHSLAVAMRNNKVLAFQNWFKKNAKDSRMANLLNSDMPSNRGTKKTKNTQVRKGSSNRPAQTITEYLPRPQYHLPRPQTPSYNLNSQQVLPRAQYLPARPQIPSSGQQVFPIPNGTITVRKSTSNAVTGNSNLVRGNATVHTTSIPTRPTNFRQSVPHTVTTCALPPNVKPPFRLKWLENTSAYVCYGCGASLREGTSPSKKVPQPPFNVVIAGFEIKNYNGKEYSSVPSDTHYHLFKACVQKKHPHFTGRMLFISGEDKAKFQPEHLYYILEEFDLQVL